MTIFQASILGSKKHVSHLSFPWSWRKNKFKKCFVLFKDTHILDWKLKLVSDRKISANDGCGYACVESSYLPLIRWCSTDQIIIWMNNIKIKYLVFILSNKQTQNCTIYNTYWLAVWFIVSGLFNKFKHIRLNWHNI